MNETDTQTVRKYLEEALRFVGEAEQFGDPNGGKAYQAQKLIKYALDHLKEVRVSTQAKDIAVQTEVPVAHTKCKKCGGYFNEPAPRGNDCIGKTDIYFIGGKWSRDLLPGDGVGHYTAWEFTCWECLV